jgi:hypothetical protein
MSNSQAFNAIWTSPEPIWTWNGECFGFRRGDSLFTYHGVEVGRFVGKEVYGPDGRYLGEMGNADDGPRLLTSAYKKSLQAEAFAPTIESAHTKAARRNAESLYCGFEDFSSPEILKAMVLELRARLRSLAATSPLS